MGSLLAYFLTKRKVFFDRDGESGVRVGGGGVEFSFHDNCVGEDRGVRKPCPRPITPQRRIAWELPPTDWGGVPWRYFPSMQRR